MAISRRIAEQARALIFESGGKEREKRIVGEIFLLVAWRQCRAINFLVADDIVYGRV